MCSRLSRFVLKLIFTQPELSRNALHRSYNRKSARAAQPVKPGTATTDRHRHTSRSWSISSVTRRKKRASSSFVRRRTLDDFHFYVHTHATHFDSRRRYSVTSRFPLLFQYRFKECDGSTIQSELHAHVTNCCPCLAGL